jgi:hypothetical protein
MHTTSSSPASPVVNSKVRTKKALPHRPFSAYREPRADEGWGKCDFDFGKLSAAVAVEIDDVMALQTLMRFIRCRNVSVVAKSN